MKLPEGLKDPGWLRTIKFATNPFNYMEAVNQRYGDIVTVMFDSTPVILISNPEGLKELFTKNQKIKAPGELNRAMALMTGSQGVLQLDGKRHKHRRRLLMSAFHGERMRNCGQRICELTDKALAQQTVGSSFIAYPVIEDITLGVILKVVLGLQEGERYQKFKKLLVAALKQILSPSILLANNIPFLQIDWGHRSPWGYLLHLRKELYQLLYAEIEERRQQAKPCGDDLLSELISARDETGKPLDNEELRDLLLSPLFAGQDASATAITWALYWIHRLPKVRDCLLEEIDSLGESPNPLSIAQLPYLSAVCNEALRIYPTQVLTFPRRVEEPVKLMGYDLDPGTLLVGNIYLTHQRQDLYPEPKQFKPERFLEKQFSAYEFLPFGGGERVCIGAALAMFEMKLVLGTILAKYRLGLAKQKPEKRKYKGIICYPASGLEMLMLGKNYSQQKKQQLVTS